MNILLAAINAKYIHSNLAVRSLREYALERSMAPPDISIAEYTINLQFDHILRDIYSRRPDMLCFSCYIWNIRYVRMLVRELGKVLPRTVIWLGGPEVSYDSAEVLASLPEVSGVMKGEGEETFAELAAVCSADPAAVRQCPERFLGGIAGITWRTSGGEIRENPWRPAMDMNRLPFVYHDTDDLSHRIVYYESSRGCPFSCSYCLSSVDRQLRFRDIRLVKQELKYFIDRRVPQVKFVDRTFNCRHEHAMEIWRFLIAEDNGVTNFHFEISADLLNREELELIRTMRPGLIQLEIGVQSTNPDTLREIRRTMDFARTAANVKAIAAGGNIHQHLDLIAGLPWEDLASFRRSFDNVYALRPQQLQLGFLKVLKGSYMEERRQAYGLVCQSVPPYEVLSTRWLSFDDMIRLKGIEEMVEIYYNSCQFTHTMAALADMFSSAFDMYRELAEYYRRHVAAGTSHTRAARYELLLGFISGKISGDEERLEYFREQLIYDYYLRENAKSRPAFAGIYRLDKDAQRRFYENEAAKHKYLPARTNLDKNQLRRMTHLEKFEHPDCIILFDYENRDPLTGDARVHHVATEDLVNIN